MEKYYDVKLSDVELHVMLNMIKYYKNENITYKSKLHNIRGIVRDIQTELERAKIRNG